MCVAACGGRRDRSPIPRSSSRSARWRRRSRSRPRCADSDRPAPRLTVLTVGTAAADGRCRDPRRGRRPDLRRSALVVGGGGVRPLRRASCCRSPRSQRVATRRACCWSGSSPTWRRCRCSLVSLRPPHRVRHGAAVGAHRRRCAARATASLSVPDDAVPTRAVVVVLAVVVLPGWTAVALGYVVEGYRRRSGPRLRLGLGLAVIAGAQLYRGVTGAPADRPGVRRAAAGRRARRARRAGPARRAVAAGGAVAAVGAAGGAGRRRAARRARAGSWRPSGTTSCATASPASPGSPTCSAPARTTSEQQRLKQAVLSELGRLHTILDGGAVAPDPGPREEYAVEPVLAGLVTLRRSAGAPVSLDVDPHRGGPAGLRRRRGPRPGRHQPARQLRPARPRGAGHRARLPQRGPRRRRGARRGAGAAACRSGHQLLQRGVHDPTGGGSGLGLHISARLVDREGGELDLRTVTDPLGCLATVRLPAAGAPDRPGAGRSGAAPTR